MSDVMSTETLEAVFKRLPREEDAPELLNLRVRVTTLEGRTFFAFMRSGIDTNLGFAGWEVTATPTKDEAGEVVEPEMEHFLIAGPGPGEPLYVLCEKGPLGIVSTAELEDRPAEEEPPKEDLPQ
jgi:hypothetical protein